MTAFSGTAALAGSYATVGTAYPAVGSDTAPYIVIQVTPSGTSYAILNTAAAV